MNEIERKVDMLISGMKLPPKKARRRVAGIATSLLLAIALIAGASLFTAYYTQIGEVNVESIVTITDPLGGIHDAGWTESVTIGGEGDEFYPDDPPEIIGPYTIVLNADGPLDAIFGIAVTEDDGTGPVTCNEGLTVEICQDGYPVSQINDLMSGFPETFEIHVTADKFIDTTMIYAYTITMVLQESPT